MGVGCLKPMAISPTQSNALAALRTFLMGVLPGTSGQDPAVFQGTIAGTVLTVAPLPGLAGGGIVGSIAVNSPLLGAAPGTFVLAQLTGLTGGVGTYQVSVSQALQLPRTMSTGVSVVTGQANRVPEPNNPWFVVMTPLRSRRLSTNLDKSGDVKFTGTIAGTTMTVTAVARGAIAARSQLFGVGVAAGTLIVQQLTGAAGGIGTYQVSPTQTIAVPQTLSAGRKTLQINTEEAIQLDFHAPDFTSGDHANTVSTLLRDEYATSIFKALPAPQNQITPLFADDPRQMPFINAENQFEQRFSLDCLLQVNETVDVSQEFADAVVIGLIEVDSHYPPH